MKKTIAIHKDKNGRSMCLEQIMTAATNRGYVISKHTTVFNSRKEAQDTFNALSRGLRHGVKLITLNEKQARLIDEIKTVKQRGYIHLNRFLEIK